MENSKISYDFDHPILLKEKKYRRYAREHIALSEIKSDVIEWETQEAQTALNIPVKFHVHYNVKSIVGIDENQAPIYGNRHTLEVSFPPRYPLVPCIIRMISPVWHPNIKFDGNHKGRICGNVKNFGKAYNLYQLVLRIGEILQYKNYHAEHVSPYPEDATVAKWVVEYAEPNDIVNKSKGIVVDDSPLLRKYVPETTSDIKVEKSQPETEKTAPPIEIEIQEPPKSGTEPPIPKIKITQHREQSFQRSKLVIKIKDKKKD